MTATPREDCVLVPREPTQAMVDAPSTVIQTHGARLVYQRMLAAAPSVSRDAVATVRAGAFGVHYIACVDLNMLPTGTKLYTTPAAVPERAVDAVDDSAIEKALEESGGHWIEDEFRIEAPDLYAFIRAITGSAADGETR